MSENRSAQTVGLSSETLDQTTLDAKPDNRRAWYSMVAGTAAVATTGGAQGEVLYSGVQDLEVASGVAFFIDLDLDASFTGYSYGLGDIFVSNYSYPSGNSIAMSKAYGDTGTFVGYTDGRGFGYATALAAGATIDSTTVGPSVFANLGYEGYAGTPGQFNDYPAVEKFIGLAFSTDVIGGGLNSEVHYGWIKVLASVPGGQLTLVDWAFESEAGVGIEAGDIGNGTLITDFYGPVPEPSSLALLATGAAGLLGYRKRKQVA